jgi:hypothetical protein
VTRTDSGRPPTLILSEHTVELGNVYIGDPPPHRTIAIRNDGDGELEARVMSAPDGIDVALDRNSVSIDMPTKREHEIDGVLTIESLGGAGEVRIRGAVRPEVRYRRSIQRYLMPAGAVAALVGTIGAGAVALLSDDKHEIDPAPPSTGVFGPLSFDSPLVVDLASGAALVGAAFGPPDGTFVIAADPLDDQDVVLTVLDIAGSPIVSCTRVDLRGSNAAETCTFEVGTGVGGVLVEAFGPTDAIGRVEVLASVQSPTSQQVDGPSSTNDAQPAVRAAVQLGETVEVAVAPDSTWLGLDVGDAIGAILVTVEPMDGQDVVLSLIDTAGDVLPRCALVNESPAGSIESCELTAGDEVVNGIVVSPAQPDDAIGTVAVSAVPAVETPPASDLLSGFAPEGWEYQSESGEDAALTCEGEYDREAFDSHSVWFTSSTSGVFATAYVLVFDTEAAAAAFMNTFSGSFYPGCQVGEGAILQLDRMEGSEQALYIEYTAIFEDGSSIRGDEMTTQVGRVVIDPSCERVDAQVTSAECSDFVRSLFDHLLEELDQPLATEI